MKLEKLREVCGKCGAKCCFLGGPLVTKEERDKILKSGFEDVFVPCGKYFDVKANGDRCSFLKNNLCMVQEVKPAMCLVWPVYPVFKGNERKVIVLDCPLTKYLSEADIQKLKNLAKKMPKELATGGITTLSPSMKKRLREFNWDKRLKEALE